MTPSPHRPPLIGVIGGERPPEEALPEAERVGELIARRGGIVITGGGGGVMEAVSKGAHRAGGLTIGVLPGAHKREANSYVTIPIITAMNTARNAIIVRTADALIAIDGSFGTLTEIAYALDIGKKVVLLHSWRLRRIGIDDGRFEEVTTPEDAVERAFKNAARDGHAGHE